MFTILRLGEYKVLILAAELIILKGDIENEEL